MSPFARSVGMFVCRVSLIDFRCSMVDRERERESEGKRISDEPMDPGVVSSEKAFVRRLPRSLGLLSFLLESFVFVDFVT